MNEITATLQNAFNEILLFLPNLLKALILFAIAWGVAFLVRKLVTKVLVKTNVGEHLAKSRKPMDLNYGKERINDISKIAYYLVFLLFLPGIFSALDLDAISQPITGMMSSLLAYVPNLIGAAVIVFIGYFVAKIIRDLTFTFLQTVNIDKWYGKMNPRSTQLELDPAKKNTLADVLSKIVFGLVLIPVITSALETLDIRSLTEPIVAVLNKSMQMLPNVIVALMLIVIGYYIANFVAQILENLLERAGINNVFDWVSTDVSTQTIRFDLAKVIAKIVQVVIVLFITVEALSILKLEVLNTIGSSIIAYLPLLISGLLIIGGGVVAGYFVEGLINKYAKSPFTAAIAKYIIIIFAVFMTLEQIKFASTIVNIAFLLVLGGLSVAFALAFGLGGRDFAKRQLERFEDKVEAENKKPVSTNNPLDKIKKGINENKSNVKEDLRTVEISDKGIDQDHNFDGR